MSRPGKADSLRGRPDCWSATVWLLALTALCGVCDFLALPDGGVWLGLPLSGHEMFRPEWLVVATFVAFPLVRLARASMLLGLLGFVLATGEMYTMVDNARERFVHNADLFGGGPGFPTAYYGLVVVQAVIFAVATGIGLRRRWADRRWERMMRRMTKARQAQPRLDVPPKQEQVAD